MKKTGIISALLAVLLAGCGKPTAEISPSDADAESAPPPPAVEPATPAPIAAELPPPPPAVTPPPAPEIAPPGRYYLRRKTSVETAEGLTGYPPGTALQQTSAGHYQTDNGHDLTLAEADVTNDLAEARLLTGQSVAVQAAARAAAAPRPMPAAETNAAPTRSRARETPVPQYVAPVVGGSSGLQGSTALGSGHSKTDDGILWQKSADGKWWVPVKWLRGGQYPLPPNRPVK